MASAINDLNIQRYLLQLVAAQSSTPNSNKILQSPTKSRLDNPFQEPISPLQQRTNDKNLFSSDINVNNKQVSPTHTSDDILRLSRNISDASLAKLDEATKAGKENRIPDALIETYIQAASASLQVLRSRTENNLEKKHRVFLVKLIELEKYRYAETEIWRIFLFIKWKNDSYINSKKTRYSLEKELLSPNHKMIISGIRLEGSSPNLTSPNKQTHEYINLMILYLQAIYLSYKLKNRLVGSEDLLSLFTLSKSCFLQSIINIQIELRISSLGLLCKLVTSFSKLPTLPRILKSLLILRFASFVITINQECISLVPNIQNHVSSWLSIMINDLHNNLSNDTQTFLAESIRIYKYVAGDLYHFCFEFCNAQPSKTLFSTKHLEKIRSLVTHFSKIESGIMYAGSYESLDQKPIEDTLNWGCLVHKVESHIDPDQKGLFSSFENMLSISPESLSKTTIERSFNSQKSPEFLALWQHEKYVKSLCTYASKIIDNKNVDMGVKQYLVKETLNSFNGSITNNFKILRPHLTLLDVITIFIKALLPAVGDYLFNFQTLEALAQITQKCKQTKRLRNVSNLHYNLALQLIKLQQETQGPFSAIENDNNQLIEKMIENLGKSLNIEAIIYQYDENLDQNFKEYESKLQKSVSIMSKYQEYERAVQICCTFLKMHNVEPTNGQTFSTYYSQYQNQSQSVILLLLKCFINNGNQLTSSFLFEEFLPASRALLFLYLIETLASLTLVKDKSTIANALLDSLSIDDDPLLYYYCYIKYLSLPNLTSLAEIQIFDDSNSEIFENSCLSNFKSLVINALNFKVLTKFNNDFKNPNLIIELFDLFVNWMNESTLMTNGVNMTSQDLISEPKNTLMLQLEVDLVQQIISYFKYYGIYTYLCALVSQYAANRELLLEKDIHFKLQLMFTAVECCINLNFGEIAIHNIEELSSFIEKNLEIIQSTNSIKRTYFYQFQQQPIQYLLFQLKILQLKACILMNDSVQAEVIFKSSLDLIQNHPDFFFISIMDFVDNNKSSSTSVQMSSGEMNSMMIAYSEFSYVLAMLKFKGGVFQDALYDLRRAVRIILVLTKRLQFGYGEQKSSSMTKSSTLEIIIWEATSLLAKIYNFLIFLCLHYGFSKDCEHFIKELRKIVFDFDYLPLVSAKLSHTILLYYILGNKSAMAKNYFTNMESTYNSIFYIDKELTLSYHCSCIRYYHYLTNDEPCSFDVTPSSSGASASSKLNSVESNNGKTRRTISGVSAVKKQIGKDSAQGKSNVKNLNKEFADKMYEHYDKLRHELNLLSSYALNVENSQHSMDSGGDLQMTKADISADGLVRGFESGSSLIVLSVYNRLGERDLERLKSMKTQVENFLVSKFDNDNIRKYSIRLHAVKDEDGQSLSFSNPANFLSQSTSPSIIGPKAAYHSSQDKVFDNIMFAKKHLISAKDSLARDPVLAVLQDSALSIQSAIISDKSGHEKVFKTLSKFTSISTTKIVSFANKALRLSMQNIIQDFGNIKQFASNILLNEASYTLAYSLILASAISMDASHKDMLKQLISLSELPRQLPFVHENQMANYQEDIKLLLPKTDLFSESHNSGTDAPTLLEDNRLFDDINTYLPNNWNVVTVDICPFTGDLLLVKLMKDTNPFTIRLPLNRFSSRDVGEEFISFKDAKRDFVDIIKKNNESTVLAKEVQLASAEARKLWWKQRYYLNARLEKLLKDIEFYWLGGFKGIFDQNSYYNNYEGKPRIERFKTKFMEILEENLPSRKKLRLLEKSSLSSRKKGSWLRTSSVPIFSSSLFQRQQQQKQQQSATMKSKFDSYQQNKIEIDNAVIELFLALGDPSKLKETELLEDLIYFALDILSFHGEENAYDEIDIDQIYVEVEELLKKFYQDSITADAKIQHIVLVVGKTCQNLPWESLPCLQDTSVSRMPSLALLLNTLKKHHNSNNPGDLTLGTEKGYYVLNPSRDLARTQEMFESRLATNLPHWDHKVCEEPAEEEIMNALVESDLYVYIGHGGGEHYIRNHKLKKLSAFQNGRPGGSGNTQVGTGDRKECASALLLGCSSGSLTDNGQLEPNGTVFSYLIAGAPMVVANLWDVTDKDIDKFSDALFENWGMFRDAKRTSTNINHDANAAVIIADNDADINASGNNDNGKGVGMNICEAVAAARKACMLKYLNGAAPIVYGLPFSLKK